MLPMVSKEYTVCESSAQHVAVQGADLELWQVSCVSVHGAENAYATLRSCDVMGSLMYLNGPCYDHRQI